jgi:glycosyltransferase involved in cell wall biosynthesis
VPKPAFLARYRRVQGQRPIAYLSPFFNDTNAYIEIQKQLLESLSFDVRRLSRAVTSREILQLFDRRNTICFHWPELKAIEAGCGFNGFRPLGFIGWLFYLLIAATARARVCYWIHDHSVHDTRGLLKRLSSVLIRAFSAVADVRIVHDPRAVKEYCAKYVPHPLYYQFVGSPSPDRRKTDSQTVRFGILGAVRPYKRIDEILRHWPNGRPLLIAGWAPPEFAQRLNSIIDERGLVACVETRFRFLEREAFDAALDSIDVLVLPHASGTALVSGAVFEAVGRVPVIIVRRSPFTEYLSEHIPGVVLFERDDEIAAAVGRAQSSLAQGSQVPATEARRLFGTDRVLEALSVALCPPVFRVRGV